jgi:hypothetical protein
LPVKPVDEDIELLRADARVLQPGTELPVLRLPPAGQAADVGRGDFPDEKNLPVPYLARGYKQLLMVAGRAAGQLKFLPLTSLL